MERRPTRLDKKISSKAKLINLYILKQHMHLYEHEGKTLFKKFNIPIPKGVLVTSAAQAPTATKKLGKDIILKAQVLHGKRGKAGLIKIASKETAKSIASSLLKHPNVAQLLIEEKISIAKEYYLSISTNNTNYTLIFSTMGGINIEEVQKNKIKKHNFTQFNKKTKQKINKLTKNKDITEIAHKLFKAMQSSDATLVEINPLAKTKSNHFIALDAKITIDTNALYRQPMYNKLYGREHTVLETKAQKHDLHYVELDGNIAVIGNGAGLVMSTLDTLKLHKLRPANFCDAPGGTEKKAMIESLKIVTKKKGIKKIFINMFGGITKTDEVAQAIIEFKKRYKPRKPMIIRMFGTNWKKAHEILKKNKIKVFRTVAPAIKELRK
jgi:succinyl-CoA synthetase beta subunit